MSSSKDGMPRIELGSDSGSAPKAPTLKQFAEKTNGKVPAISFVRIIFAPGKVPNYTLVTDHDFRVNVHKGSALFGVLNESLAEYAERNVALAVCPDSEDIGKFSLMLDDERHAEWTDKEWGWAIELSKPPTATSKVTRK